MKIVFSIIAGLLIFSKISGQITEIYTGESNSLAANGDKPELLTKGFVDYGVAGQIQASAQLLKLNIGEPEGFKIPIYIITSATSGNLGDNEKNKSTLFDIINPTGGILNLGANLNSRIIKISKSGITNLRFNSFFCGKLLSGRELLTDASKINTGFYLEPGVTFQTGAWEADEGYKDGGIFWLSLKYVFTYVSEEDLRTYFESSSTKSPNGPKIELGILIKEKVNIKITIFKALSGDDLPTLNKEQYKLAFDYNLFKK